MKEQLKQFEDEEQMLAELIIKEDAVVDLNLLSQPSSKTQDLS